MASFRALLVLGLAVQLCPSQSHDSLEVYYELQPPKHEYQPPKEYDAQEPSTIYGFQVFKKDDYQEPVKGYNYQEPHKKDDYQEPLKKDGYQEPLLVSYQEPPKTYQEVTTKISYQEPVEIYKEPPQTSYGEPSKAYDYLEPSKAFNYQEPSKKADYQEPVIVSYQEPPKTSYKEPSKKDGYQDPVKTSSEESSQEYNYQEPAKTYEYQEPQKKDDYQEPAKTYEYQVPQKKDDYQEPAKTYEYQVPQKKDDYQEPAKTYDYQEPQKKDDYQEPAKTYDYQVPQKKDDYQEPAKTYDYQEPQKKDDYQEPSKTYGGEDAYRDDYHEPSKTYSYQEPSKAFVHQKSTKAEYQKSLDYKYKEPSYDSREHDAAYLASLSINIPGGGVPGKDYPILATVPYTGFSCDGLEYPGHYADYRARCQVYHICQKDGRHSSFLCPNGTVFSQWYSVCDWWFNVDCNGAQTWFVYTRNGIILGKDADSSRPVGAFSRLPPKPRIGRVSKGLVTSGDYVPPVESSKVSYSAEEYDKSVPTPVIYEVPLISHSSSSEYAVEYKQSTTTEPQRNYEHDSSEDSYETGTQRKPLGTSQESYTSKPHVNNFARRVVISVRNKADAKKPTSRYVTDVDSNEHDVSTTDVSHFRQGHVKPLFRDSVRRFETKRTTLVHSPRLPPPERSLITLYRNPQ
ncbi:uncharacterized protein LOC125035385 [Penaeus chinensis]|uniref:uncharacterized protein LOC125035385 n=1 Tax=Penaeus chinensis TaxID=139456 RepID=UPI001FB65641|nr:uncharacterized protein LOC125035385 [Penaeus chinensis]